jgi:hypothetical protein
MSQSYLRNSCWIDSDDHGEYTDMIISAGLYGATGSNWVTCANG